MTQQDAPFEKVDVLPTASPDARYAACVQLGTYEGQVIWARYNGMLVAVSILANLVPVLFSSARWATAGILCSVGLLLSILWWLPLPCSHGWKLQAMWLKEALDFEPASGSGRPLRQ